MSGGSNGAYNRSERDVSFMHFRLTIDPRGLGVVRNQTLLDLRINEGRFDSFGNHVGDAVNRVFGLQFIGRGRKEAKKFGVIVGSVHDNRGISFIGCEDKDVRVVIKLTNNKKLFFS
jgi:hypothetical protein